MWQIRPPEVEVAEIANNSVSKVRDKNLSGRVKASIRLLEKNNDRFMASTKELRTHEIDASSYEVSNVRDEEFRWLYTQQLAKPTGGARNEYNEILANALFELCSYCQHGQATTLDHFIPKSWLAQLAIDPWNLVPACQQCNKKLLDTRPDSAAKQMFHPYCEGVSSRWLHAEVIEGEPTAIRFEARPCPDLDQVTRDRVKNQFKELGLALMYSAVSARDIVEAKSGLTGKLANSLTNSSNERTTKYFGNGVVKDLLSETANIAFSADPNSRRGAVYQALSESDWFCNEGYLL